MAATSAPVFGFLSNREGLDVQADLIARLPALTAAGIGLRHGCTPVSCLSSASSRRAPTHRPFGGSEGGRRSRSKFHGRLGRVWSGSRPGPAIDQLLKPGAAFATVRTLARVDVAGTRVAAAAKGLDSRCGTRRKG